MADGPKAQAHGAIWSQTDWLMPRDWFTRVSGDLTGIEATSPPQSPSPFEGEGEEKYEGLRPSWLPRLPIDAGTLTAPGGLPKTLCQRGWGAVRVASQADLTEIWATSPPQSPSPFEGEGEEKHEGLRPSWLPRLPIDGGTLTAPGGLPKTLCQRGWGAVRVASQANLTEICTTSPLSPPLLSKERGKKSMRGTPPKPPPESSALWTLADGEREESGIWGGASPLMLPVDEATGISLPRQR